MIPLHIVFKSMFVSVLRDPTNVAKGEIVNMSFKDSEKEPFNKQVVGNCDGYDWIWRHLGDNYWKVIGKYKESPWSCQ